MRCGRMNISMCSQSHGRRGRLPYPLEQLEHMLQHKWGCCGWWVVPGYGTCESVQPVQRVLWDTKWVLQSATMLLCNRFQGMSAQQLLWALFHAEWSRWGLGGQLGCVLLQVYAARTDLTQVLSSTGLHFGSIMVLVKLRRHPGFETEEAPRL